MKYRWVYSKLVSDAETFRKYICEETDTGFVVEFEEKDAAEIYDRQFRSVIDSQARGYCKRLADRGFPQVFGVCVESGMIHSVSPDGLECTGQKSSLKKIKNQSKKYHKIMSTLNEETDRKLAETPCTQSVKKSGGSQFKRYDFISKEYNYALSYHFRPAKSEGAPLVIFNCWMRGFKKNGLWKKLKKRDCSILVLDGVKTDFFGKNGIYESVDVIKQLADSLCEKYNADKNRIYFTGVSGGGRIAWISAYKYPEYYACIVPAMGSLTIGEEPDYERLKNVPIWIAQAEDDKIASPLLNDEAYDALKKIGGNVKYTRYEKGGHGISPKFFKNENWDEWMFSQSLENR
ncbi:MAG: hypothetical protein J6J45_07905 [Clostridia bacterium]|nr:hypothetical protein [Clostridia bacterium]